LQACVHGHWEEAKEMIEGMLAEPWHLQSYQETRLREFRELVELDQGHSGRQDQAA
jgi:hypothetical protein